MAKYAELPDGTRLEFPDDVSDAVMDSVVAKHMGEMIKPQAMPEERSTAENLGLGSRAVLEGLGDIPQAVVNPFFNLVNSAMGGDPRHFGNAGTALADMIGLPQPSTKADNLVNSAIRGVAGAVPTMGLGAALSGGGRVAQGVGRTLTEAPTMQAVTGLTAGGAVGAAQNTDTDMTGQMTAGVAGGIAPLLLAALGKGAIAPVGRGAVNYLDQLTQSGKQRAAATTVEQFMGNKPDVINRLGDLGEDSGVLVQGSNPTLAQLTGDTGLARLEKALASGTEGGGITDRYTTQINAQRDNLNELLNPIDARNRAALSQVENDLRSFAPESGTIDERNLGATIRNDFQDRYRGMKQQVRSVYDSIDPDNTTSFDLRPLIADFEQTLASGGRFQQVPSEIQSTLKAMQDLVNNGQNATYQDLQGIRTLLSEYVQGAATSGNPSLGRIAGMLRGQVDDYLLRGANDPQLMGQAPTAQRGSAAYREATDFGRNAVNDDAWYNDLQYLGSMGLKRDAVERLVGRAGVEHLNTLYPNLVRRNGQLLPDTITSDLESFAGLINETGGGTYHADADAFLQALESRLSGMYGRKNNAVEAHRNTYLETMPKQTHTGFSPQQAQDFLRAKALRTEQGQRFESGSNRPLTLKGNTLDNERIADSAIPSAYFTGGASGGERLEALMRALATDGIDDNFNMVLNPALTQNVRGGLQDFAIRKALEASINPQTGVVDATKLRGFMKNYSPALAQMNDTELLTVLKNSLENQQANEAATSALADLAKRDVAGNWELRQSRMQYPQPSQQANLTADELQRLHAAQMDRQRVQMTDAAAQTKGSPTAQLQAALREIQKQGRITPENQGILSRLWAKVADTFAGDIDADIQADMVRMMLDPEYAFRMLLDTNTMKGKGMIDSVRRWSGDPVNAQQAREVLKKYGIGTAVTSGRLPAQAKEQ